MTLGLALSAVAAEPKREFQLMPVQSFVPRQGLGNVFAKLAEGKEVRIAYFGGSITAAPGWRPKTLKWFKETYPQANISEINAAIGGTGSDLGVYRFQQDVLRHKPDLVFVEFSVNDENATPVNIWRGMEGIVRQAWKADPNIDICYIYTFRVGYEKQLDQNLYSPAASADEILAEHYGIPSINPALRVAEMARENKLVFTPVKGETGKNQPTPEGVTLFSNDGVHPTDAGQEIYTNVITNALQQIAAKSEAKPHLLPTPFIADNWEQAKLVPLEPSMLSNGWKKLDTENGLGKQFRERLPEVWEATQPGEKITFKFKGTAARLYDIMGPDAGQVIVTIDGKASAPRSRFDSYSTYHRINSLGIAGGLADEVHTVTIEIHPEQPDRAVAIAKEKGEFDPKKYVGTNVRVGGIMILGDIVKE